MPITIDPQFKSLIPPLSPEERSQLERNIVAEGCRDPLVVWNEILIDGHNRHEICERLSIPYNVVEKSFADKTEARVWIRNNQRGRRNLSDAWKLELEFGNKQDLAELGRAKKVEAGKQSRAKQLGGDDAGVLSINDKTPSEPKHNTRNEIAKSADMSTGKVAQAEVVRKKSPELWERAKEGELTIGAAYKEVQQAERKEQKAQAITQLKEREVSPADGRYDVIVIDPPWPMEKIEREVRPNQVAFDYPTMSEDEIRAVHLPMADDCHVWIWTTHKFLPMALRCLDAWGLRYVCTFVWHKPGGFQPIGLPQYNAEFALYARKGSPLFVDTKAFNTAFNAPRGAHSEKPEEFYDVVRRVTAGKRIDMFNRREIDGFDTWGNESGDRLAS